MLDQMKLMGGFVRKTKEERNTVINTGLEQVQRWYGG